MITDIHCLPVAATTLLARLGHMGAGFRGQHYTDSDEDIVFRLSLMSEAGVQKQILSPPPIPPLANEQDAVTVAKTINLALKRLKDLHPQHFGAFAVLPMPHVAASIAQLHWVLGDLGMDGITLLCSYDGVSAAAPAFDAVYATANSYGTVLLWHPAVNGVCAPLFNDYELAAAVGTSVEDALIALHCVIREIPSRFPRVRMVVPHLGGPLIGLLNRLDNQLPLAHPNLTEAPSRSIRRFWFDSVAHGFAPALRCACEAYGADRIVPGSDYPYLLPYESYAQTLSYIGNAGLPHQEVARVLHVNVQELFTESHARVDASS